MGMPYQRLAEGEPREERQPVERQEVERQPVEGKPRRSLVVDSEQ